MEIAHEIRPTPMTFYEPAASGMKDGRISVEMHGPAGGCCDAVKATLHLMTRGYHHASPHLRRFYTSENLAQ